ncbi:MAG: DUF2066 domain-containing protein [Pseudomonadota bacterium]
MLRGSRLLAATGLLLLALGAIAETVDPWEVTVPVADRSERARRAALGDALALALVRLTGSRVAAERADSAAAEPMVRQFRYLEGVNAEGEPEVQLQVTFVPDAVQELVIRMGETIWPLERGTTVLWVAVEDDGRRRLLGLSPDDEVTLALAARTADERAMPLVLPLLDLEDQTMLSAAEIWGGFDDRIRAASQRYEAEQTLAGRIAVEWNVLVGRWMLFTGARLVRWENTGETVDDVLRGAMEEAADRLAIEFGVRPEPMTDAGSRIVVRGVSDPRAFAEVLAYLEALSVVESVQVREVVGDTVRLQLGLLGDVQALDRAVALGEVLVFEGVAPDGSESYSLRAEPLNAEAFPIDGG